MTHLTSFKLVLVSGILLITNLLANADENKFGTIAGTVVNSSTEEPLFGANVIIIGTTLGAGTDSEGRFVITGIPVGNHAVRASVVGFQTKTISDVVVTTAKPAQVRFELVEMELDLGELTVNAGFFSKDPDEPTSTSTLSSEEIRRLPGGFEDVVRAVSILPGVAQASPGRNDLIVRGGAPSENLYIVDNIEVPNINHFGTQGAAGGPQSFINLDFIEDTQFSTGGFGVRYGDRLSSVLNISLREGRNDRLGGKATISASQFGLNLEGPLGKKGDFLFSARRSYLDFIFKAAGASFIPEFWDFQSKILYNLSPHDRITALAVLALDNVRLNNETTDQRFSNSRILAPEQNQAIGGVSWRHLFGWGFSTVTLGQSYIEYRTEQQDSLLNPIFRNNSMEHESSLRGDLVIALSPRTELSLGVKGTQAQFNADLKLDTLKTSFGDTLFTDAVYDEVAWKTSTFMQISHKFDYLRWTIGGRLDYFNLLKNQTAFSPRVSLSVPVGNRTDINLSLGRYYQSPSYIWLVSHEQNRNLNFIGVNQLVVGVDRLFRQDTKFILEYYYKDYFDYPVSQMRPYLIMSNTGAGWGGTDEGFATFGLDPLTSDGKGRTMGVELSIQKRFSEVPCYGLVSLSYNHSNYQALDGITRPSSYDQRWIFNIGGGYVINDNWEIASKFRYASGRPYTPFASDGTQDPILYNSIRLPANHSLDVRVDRRWYFTGRVLTFYLDIQNVYNNKPSEAPSWNAREGQPENDISIGILPSLGLSLEF